MRLTRHTDYAVRMLMFLALRDGQLGTIREIANAYGISRNHLMKVVQDLNHRGYITAIRGKNGGLLLKRAPETIRLGELVRDTERDMNLVECFGDANECVITPACRLKPILAEALNAFLAVLDHYTLADLMGPQRPKLIGLLQLDDVPPAS